MRLVIVDNFLWVLSVYAAFFGFGRALACVLGLRRDAGTAGSLGVAFAVGCGGLIDLLCIMGPSTAYAFVFAGVSLAVVQYLPTLRALRVPSLPPDRTGRVLLAVVALLACVAIGGYVYSTTFHKTDDYSAYLAFPQKMLETGSLGFEPFSERRLATSVGGLYFLQALVSAGSGVFFFHAIDPALALALILLLLESAMRGHGVALSSRLAVLLLLLLLLPTVNNLTANLLPIALMLCMYLLLEADTRQEQCAGRFVAMALLGSATIALKSAYLPWVGSFLAFAYGGRIIAGRFAWRTWREPAATAAIMLATLLPWLAANLHDVGTILFPTFGRGFYASEYGMFRPPWVAPPSGGYLTALTFEARKLGPAIFAAWMIFGLMLACLRRRPDPRMERSVVLTAGFLASSLVLVATVAVGTGFLDEVPRYAYPGVAGALLVALYRWMVVRASTPPADWWADRGAKGLVLAAVLFLVSDNSHAFYQYYGHAISNTGMAVLGPAVRPAMLPGVVADEVGGARTAVARMQRAIPPGATILERLDYPFLLDFSRNNVLIADWPGETSPPPGMPVFKGPEDLAAYLLRASIRYVAYGYADEAEFPASEADRLLGRGEWLETETRMALDFQRNLDKLMQTRRLVYKDSQRVVIDLAEPVERPGQELMAAFDPP